MFKTKRNIVLALALCTLLLPVAVTAKDQVERPFKCHGEAKIILDLLSGAWTKTHSGVATHAGAYSGPGSGVDSIGSGTVTAANGDTVNWVVAMTVLNLDSANMTAHIEGTVTCTGGTGQFEGASGSVAIVYDGTMEFIGPTVVKLTLAYRATGRITY